MVGFITLFGVAARNGLLLVENYNARLAAGNLYGSYHQRVDGKISCYFNDCSILRTGNGTFSNGSGAGKEILQPLAVVVLGGLFTSTALTLLVLPACYVQFSRFLQPRSESSLVNVDVSQSSIG